MLAYALAFWLAALAPAQESPVCLYDSTGRLVCVTAAEFQLILEGKSKLPSASTGETPSYKSCSIPTPEAGETRSKVKTSNDEWRYPLKRRWNISSDFGYRTINGKKDWHSGLDIACYSYTEVYAARPGTVFYAGKDPGFGKVVIIEHSDGSKSYYGHLSEWLVKTGQTVSHDTLIAKSGNTGHSTGAHLHFEVHNAADKALDPAPLLGLSPVTAAR